MDANVVRLTRFCSLAALASLPFAFSSCLKTEEFPNEPILTFQKIEQVYEPNSSNDTARGWYFYITVGFTDGDGDIGLNEEDTYSPFGQDEDHYHNYFTRIRKRTDGQWADFGDPWRYRMRRITPTGQDPTLNGEITVRMGPLPVNLPFPTASLHPGDTLEVTVQLEDRSLNMSNTVTTGTFVF